MDKLTYLAELAEGLARWVPERERQDILRYYAEYFEEAGPEREAQVVQELGDPWALSCRLAVEGGYVTQEQAVNWTPKKKKKWPWVVAGVAAVVVFLIGATAVSMVRFGLSLAQMISGFVVEEVPAVAHIVDEAQNQPRSEFEYSDESIPDDWQFYFWAVEDGSLEAFDTIDADIGLGNIIVTSGDDFTLYIDRSPSLAGYELKWEVKDGTLKLKDGGAANHVEINNWGDMKDGLKELFANQRALDVTITVPETALLEKIAVKTGLGNVSLYDVSAGKVTAETGMGDVECYNFRQVKKLNLETGMGNVALYMDEPESGVDIDLESGMGHVEASLGCAEWDCAYELESGMGTVTVNGDSRGSKAERKGNTSYKLDAESGMGDVTVYFD